MTTEPTYPSHPISTNPHVQKTYEALCKAVSDTLERKRRLGHYYVFYRDGQTIIEGEDDPQDLNKT
jgi:hypothetical protein